MHVSKLEDQLAHLENALTPSENIRQEQIQIMMNGLSIDAFKEECKVHVARTKTYLMDRFQVLSGKLTTYLKNAVPEWREFLEDDKKVQEQLINHPERDNLAPTSSLLKQFRKESSKRVLCSCCLVSEPIKTN